MRQGSGRAPLSRGVIYVATGSRHVAEALRSARSLRIQMPDIHITLYCDIPELVAAAPDPLFSVILLQEVHQSCRDKIAPLARTPYSKTLFLDSDTFVCAALDDLFDMLDHYDIALAHAPDRCQYPMPHLPECFPELNSGVIAYRMNRKVRKLLSQWETTFRRLLNKDPMSYRDQHSLREALYQSEVRFLVLPPEYNFRTIVPNFAGRNGRVKIIHGRHADMAKVAARLNASTAARVFLQHPFRVWTRELSTYESLTESLANMAFQCLPQRWKKGLSTLRHRYRRQG